MTAPTIDRATFDALQETAGAEFVGELVDTFLERGAADAAATCAQRWPPSDADRFRRAAHSLKSNSNTFGALDARRAWRGTWNSAGSTAFARPARSRWTRWRTNTRGSPPR